MKCLCCEKILQKEDEVKTGWHKKCVKRFFGTGVLPEIHIDDETLAEIASKSTLQGLTVPGVQKKLSLHLLSEESSAPRLTVVNFPAVYILKPQSPEFSCLPEIEHLAMSMADLCGINTVPHALIKDGDSMAYITRRIDRTGEDLSEKLAMEDFCQLTGRLTQDKYKGSCERCGKIIEKYSSTPMLDMTEFFLRIVFCFIIGNSDMHLKNFSLTESAPGSGEYSLSPAYDLLSVNIVMPEDKEETGLTLNGKKKNLRREDFLALGKNIGLTEKQCEKIISMAAGKKHMLAEMCLDSNVSQSMKAALVSLMEKRTDTLMAHSQIP